MEKFVFKDYGQAVEIADFINNVVIPDFNSLLERHINSCAKGRAERLRQDEEIKHLSLSADKITENQEMIVDTFAPRLLELKNRIKKLECIREIKNPHLYNSDYQTGRLEMKAELKNKFDRFEELNLAYGKRPDLRKELFGE